MSLEPFADKTRCETYFDLNAPAAGIAILHLRVENRSPDITWLLRKAQCKLLVSGADSPLGDTFTSRSTASGEALALRKKLLGNEHSDVAVSLGGLADVLYDEGKLAEAEVFQHEELALRRKLLQKQSPPRPASVSGFADACFRLTRTLIAESKFSEADPLAREGLAFGEKNLPDDWQTFNARSLLGETVSGQQKFSEAESLLLAGYDGLKQREHSIPDEHKSRPSEAIQRIVRLYEATGRPELAKQWREEMQPAKSEQSQISQQNKARI